jgi:hypothetical protein
MKFWLRLLKRIFLMILILMASISLVLFVFEDRIIKKVVAEANTHLKVPVQVREIDLHFWRTFPRLSVAFNDVLVADPLQKTDTLLHAQQISLRFNPFDVFGGTYQIQQISAFNGIANIKEDQRGHANYDIFKPSTEGSSAFNLELESIFLEEFRLRYTDQKNVQFYSADIHSATLSGHFSDQKTTLKASGAVQLKKIKKGRVILLQNQPLDFDIALLVDQVQNTIRLPQAQIKIANLPFLIDGDFSPLSSNVDIRTEQLSLLQLVKTLSPANLSSLQQLKAEGIVDFQLHYQSSPDLKSPSVEAYFSIKDGMLTEPTFGAKIKDLQCFGSYKNLPTDQLLIDRFGFKSQGAQFAGQLALQDFLKPQLQIKAGGDIPLALVQALYPIAAVEEIKGVAKLRINGQFAQNAAQEWQTNALTGNVAISAPHLQIADFKKRFHSVRSNIDFTKDNLSIHQFKAEIGKSAFQLEAKIPDFMERLTQEAPLLISGSLQSKQLDISDFDTKSATKERDWILPSSLDVRLPFEIKTLLYDHKEFQHLSGALTLSPRQLLLSKLQFGHVQGRWQGQVQLKEDAPCKFAIATNGSARQVELSTFFKQWNNFDQSVLTNEQLTGKGNFEFDVNTKYDFYKGLDEASLRAQIHCRIDNGRLYHAPILQDLASSLTFGKGRAILGAKNQAALQQKLKDVRFETLENTFTIADRQLRFKKMHIGSSALDLDLVGQHSFDHDIDYAIGLRLRDLMVQETQSEFGEIMDDGTGLRLFVRISGNLSDPKVSWDQKGKKEAAQQQFEQSKQESKEMLKAAFGLYQNDPSVGTYKTEKIPHETIKLKFNTNEPAAKTQVNSKLATEKSNKLQQKLEKWKQEQQQGAEVNVKIGG